MSIPSPGKKEEFNWRDPETGEALPDEAVRTPLENVAGQATTPQAQGFGRLVEKTYTIRLENSDITPQEVIRVWKAEFPDFWPEGQQFYAPVNGIEVGETGLLTLGAGEIKLVATGVRIIESNAESFTFETFEGHPFAGTVHFSSFVDQGILTAQVRARVRANDPIYEVMLRIGGKGEDWFWMHTLKALACRFGVEAEPETETRVVDPKVKWRAAKNVRQNAVLRSLFRKLSAPLRLFTNPKGGK